MRIIRTLEKMAADTESSETDEQWKHVYQAIDAERPHRPLFDRLNSYSVIYSLILGFWDSSVTNAARCGWIA